MIKDMHKELLFGAAYYPEYMPYDRIKEDMEMMKAAGMNTIRIAESTWSTLEPEDGSFDFSYLDRTLDMAESMGIKVIIGTPTYAIPAWLSVKAPDIMVTTREGQARYGHRQLMNIISPVFLKYAERIIRKLTEHTAKRNCVIGFQVDNETKHYGMADEQVQAMFRTYLKEKFGTVTSLNQAFGLAYWSNSIHSWDDLPDMRGCVNGGLCAEFDSFRRSLAARYLGFQADIVKEYKRPGQFVTHNFDFEWKKFGADIAQDGYSYGVQPDINHYEASKYLTVAGTDIYHPTQDALTGAEIAFGGDSIRCLKQDNYLVLECQAQAFKYWTPYPGQLRLHAYSHLASGAAGIMYWNWHSIHNGYETYWKGLLSHDLAANPAYLEACLLGREWKKIGHRLKGLKKNNEVALIVDNQSLTALQWFPIDKELSYNDVVRWVYDSLYEMNIECDIVDAEALIPSRYRMIITPALYSADESLLRKLKEFIKKGGVLVSTFKSFVADRHLSVYHDSQPHLLHECFGMTYNQFTEPGRTTLQGYPVRYFAELLQDDRAEVICRYEHPYWKEYGAVTRCRYKEGAAYYIGCYTDKEILKAVLRQALKDIQKEIPEVQFPVIIKSGQNEQGKKLHFIMNYSSERSSFLCQYPQATELLTGISYTKGMSVPLKDWDVLLLEEE